MGYLAYVYGDVTQPRFIHPNRPPIVLPHVCNDSRMWGAGVSGQIGKHWPAAEEEFRSGTQRLGHVQFVPYAGGPTHITIANMIAQHGILGETRPLIVAADEYRSPHAARPNEQCCQHSRPPIRIAHLAACMETVGMYALRIHGEIHCPMFGSGLAGGDRKTIEGMLAEVWCERFGLNVCVYEFNRDPASWGVIHLIQF